MPRSSFSGALTGPQVDVVIDLGNPLLNHIVDGFLKIGTVAATRAVAEDAFSAAKKRSISTSDFKHTLKKMCKEGAYWGKLSRISLCVRCMYGCDCARPPGKLLQLPHFCKLRTASTISSIALTGTVAGLYVGAEYGIERVGGHRDWTSIGTSASAHPFSSDILQKNALLGGALTGALVSAASKENKDKVLVDAITGGAIATAVEFINYLT
ncbi:hypothetical protein DVH24_032854 [Malus domestica]|uniref:Uncharacterized protein n=1 Tax=Malus domestica TaxID=3750 RepID=A0A498IMW5_MALDO|nr:hypothetical protein DVH24_032854 [Malus domestica]